MSERLTLWEVGLRDGLQGEPEHLSAQSRIALVDAAYAAGCRHLEAGSFVNPKSVPAMAGSDAVVAHAARLPGLCATGLVFNVRGLDALKAAGGHGVCIVVLVTDALAQSNTGRGAQASLASGVELVRLAHAAGLFVRVDVAPAFVCPFSGETPEAAVHEAVARVFEAGADEVALADTIGHAHPGLVRARFTALGHAFGLSRLAAHFHDTQGLALANVTAALDVGVRTFDASLGGLGGCPFAPGAAGNLAMEDVALLASKMGFETGYDLAKVWDLVDLAGRALGRPLGGRSAAWWRAAHATLASKPPDPSRVSSGPGGVR